jgi:hypothetical protein
MIFYGVPMYRPVRLTIALSRAARRHATTDCGRDGSSAVFGGASPCWAFSWAKAKSADPSTQALASWRGPTLPRVPSPRLARLQQV